MQYALGSITQLIQQTNGSNKRFEQMLSVLICCIFGLKLL